MMRALAALLVLSSLAAGAAAEQRDPPRDPDFYHPIDPDKYDSHPVPWPDLSKRPRPRDSRTLTGVFAPDPQGTLRMMSGTQSSSTCIGEPVTPLCAVETLLRKIILRLRSSASQDRVWIYRVYDVQRAGDPMHWVQGKWWRGDSSYRRLPQWREGDILIDLLIMQCPYYDFMPSDSCRTNLVPWTYAVRKSESGLWLDVDDFIPRF